MAIQCPGCGRGYDATLFEFGRTICCTCGGRVGLEHRLTTSEPGATPRFIADAMLEKLARWLRLLGFDCAFERGITDGELVRRSLAEGRIILTRDRGIANDWRIAGIVIVPAGPTHDQLGDVVRRLDLHDRIRPYTRCSRCNAEVVEASTDEVAGRVPDRIREVYRRFVRCPRCGVVHWAGSHTTRIDRIVDSLRRR